MRKIIMFFLLISPIFGDDSAWVKEKLQEMTLDEKIGQLFMAPVCSLRDDHHIRDLEKLITEQHIGGFLMKASTIKAQRELLSTLRSKSKYPLFIAADAECGLGMRIKDGISFPLNMTLGAVTDNNLLYLLGKEIAKECKAVGVNINFAPVVDVNTNPNNPVIHMRSFGENPSIVAKKGIALIKGMQEEGILACAKHFPGHGDTTTDSHLNLPVIDKSLLRLNAVELFPFKEVIKEEVSCIMIAHLLCPAIDSKLPSSLSILTISGLLQKDMNFKGLIISDALNMGALTNYFPNSEISLKAFLAGNDILLYGDHRNEIVDKILQQDIPGGVEEIKKAIFENKIALSYLDAKVAKILLFKKRLNLFENPQNFSEINTKEATALKQTLYEKALTLVNGDKLSFNAERLQKTAYLNIGAPLTPFGEELEKRVKKSFQIPLKDQIPSKDELLSELLSFDEIILTTALIAKEKNFGMGGPKEKNFGISDEVIDFITNLSREKNCTLILFGTPYALKFFKDCKTILVAYEDDLLAQKAALKALFGQIECTGSLPVTF